MGMIIIDKTVIFRPSEWGLQEKDTLQVVAVGGGGGGGATEKTRDSNQTITVKAGNGTTSSFGTIVSAAGGNGATESVRFTGQSSLRFLGGKGGMGSGGDGFYIIEAIYGGDIKTTGGVGGGGGAGGYLPGSPIFGGNGGSRDSCTVIDATRNGGSMGGRQDGTGYQTTTGGAAGTGRQYKDSGVSDGSAGSGYGGAGGSVDQGYGGGGGSGFGAGGGGSGGIKDSGAGNIVLCCGGGGGAGELCMTGYNLTAADVTNGIPITIGTGGCGASISPTIENCWYTSGGGGGAGGCIVVFF